MMENSWKSFKKALAIVTVAAIIITGNMSGTGEILVQAMESETVSLEMQTQTPVEEAETVFSETSSETFADNTGAAIAKTAAEMSTDTFEKTAVSFGKSDIITFDALYTINFDGNGYTDGVLPDPISFSADDTDAGLTVDAPIYLLKKGFKYVENWNTSPEGSGFAYEFGSPVEIEYHVGQGDYDITLYAQWAPYHLSYDGNGSTYGAVPAPDAGFYNGVTSIEVLGNTGDASTGEPALERAGYSFTEWNTKENGSGTPYVPGDIIVRDTLMSGEDIVLYAQWATNSAMYTLSYDGNGGTGQVPEPKNYFVGDFVPVEGNSVTTPLEKAGCEFAGWNTDPNGLGTPYAAGDLFEITDAGDVTLFAQWTDIPATQFILEYDRNGGVGEVPAASSFHAGDTVTVAGNSESAPLVKAGFQFAGWNTQADGNVKTYAAGDTFIMPDNDVTLYARWTVNDDDIILGGGNTPEVTTPDGGASGGGSASGGGNTSGGGSSLGGNPTSSTPAPVRAVYDPVADNYLIVDENDTPLGYIEVPKGSTIEEIDIEENMIPLGSTKDNPVTGDLSANMDAKIKLAWVAILATAAVALVFVNKKRKEDFDFVA